MTSGCSRYQRLVGPSAVVLNPAWWSVVVVVLVSLIVVTAKFTTLPMYAACVIAPLGTALGFGMWTVARVKFVSLWLLTSVLVSSVFVYAPCANQPILHPSCLDTREHAANAFALCYLGLGCLWAWTVVFAGTLRPVWKRLRGRTARAAGSQDNDARLQRALPRALGRLLIVWGAGLQVALFGLWATEVEALPPLSESFIGSGLESVALLVDSTSELSWIPLGFVAFGLLFTSIASWPGSEYAGSAAPKVHSSLVVGIISVPFWAIMSWLKNFHGFAAHLIQESQAAFDMLFGRVALATIGVGLPALLMAAGHGIVLYVGLLLIRYRYEPPDSLWDSVATVFAVLGLTVAANVVYLFMGLLMPVNPTECALRNTWIQVQDAVGASFLDMSQGVLDTTIVVTTFLGVLAISVGTLAQGTGPGAFTVTVVGILGLALAIGRLRSRTMAGVRSMWPW